MVGHRACLSTTALLDVLKSRSDAQMCNVIRTHPWLSLDMVGLSMVRQNRRYGLQGLTRY